MSTERHRLTPDHDPPDTTPDPPHAADAPPDTQAAVPAPAKKAGKKDQPAIHERRYVVTDNKTIRVGTREVRLWKGKEISSLGYDIDALIRAGAPLREIA